MGEITPAEKKRGAVIFDRDGVLNVDVGYAHRPDQIIWIPGAKEAVRMVNEAGLYAFIATNQSGVARGYYTEETVRSLHEWMNRQLNQSSAHIDKFVISPYHPEGIVDAYSHASNCRKPAPGMILELIAEFELDQTRCVMIGDKESDVLAAQQAGIEGVLFEGGNLKKLVGPIVQRLSSLN